MGALFEALDEGVLAAASKLTGYFFAISISQKVRCPWHAVHNLPHPLASLWSHPGKVSAERHTTVNAVDDILVTTVNLVHRSSILKINHTKISL